MTTKTAPFAFQVKHELARARKLHGPLGSAHEAYAVLLEELDEFWMEVKKRRPQRSDAQMLDELIQLSAMCQRAAEDLRLIEGLWPEENDENPE